jgi:chromosome segregation ATPase
MILLCLSCSYLRLNIELYLWNKCLVLIHFSFFATEKGSLENENRLLTEQAAEERSNVLKAHELVNELKERILNLEQLIESSTQEKNDRESLLSRSIEERDNHKEAVDELREKFETLVLENQALEKKLSDDVKAVQDLQELLNAKDAALQYEQQRNETFSLRIQELEQSTEEKESLMSHLKNQQEVASDTFKRQADTEIANLRGDLELNCSKLANYSAEIEALKLEVDSRDTEIAKLKILETEIEKLTVEKEELNSIISKMSQTTNSGQTKEKNAWDDDFEGFGVDNEEVADESTRDLEHELKQAEMRNQELANSICEYERRLVQQESQIKAQEKDVSLLHDLQVQIQQLKEQNESLERENCGNDNKSDKDGDLTSHVDGWDDELPFEVCNPGEASNKEELISIK